MTAGAHDAGGGFSRSAGTNAARGIMVIVAAVAVGLLLMFRGMGDSSADTAADDTATAPEDGSQGDGAATGTDTSTTLPADGAAAESTTTTTAVSAPPRDPSEVKVLVLNGTDATSRIAGVAGAGTDLLKPANYVVLEPKDADVNGPSAVFYAEGFQAEAAQVAAVFGVDPAAVVLPLDPTASPVVDTQGANIVVRIGSDGVIKV